VFVPGYTKEEASEAVSASRSLSETLKRLGQRPAGGNFRTLRTWLDRWCITTDHFERFAGAGAGLRAFEARPLDELLIEGSTYSRQSLKRRLYSEGLKQRACEMCGQDELWNGRRMALILDHINGVANDNRIQNIRIVCPNCAATLDTHCGRNRPHLTERPCSHCGTLFLPRSEENRYCSRECGVKWDRSVLRGLRPSAHKTSWPPYEQLLGEISSIGFCAVGRRYGVSDNAVRKWVRAYERERERSADERASAGPEANTMDP
jgi:hypothetical protein